MTLNDARPVVIICTRDRARSLPFYRDILGLALSGEDQFAAVFALNGGEMRLSTVEDWKAHEHVVFGFGVENIEAEMKTLRERGVAFTIYPGFGQSEDGVWTSPDGKARVAWFKDPEGNALSLAQFKK